VFVSGDSLWLRVWFGFGHLVWLQASGLASGVFVESIVNAGLSNSFGIVQLSGKPGEKRKYCKVSRKELEARRRESICFPYC